jgi:methylmalonyl-CoA/ethylmalonyl-CoA epimerase
MTSVKRINHIAIVVDEIEDALHFWRDALGLKVTRVEEVPDQDTVVAFLPVGNAEIELVKPTSDESGVARYLKKHGQGLHHICFEVDDIETSLESLKASGVRLINSEPIIGSNGKKMAFVHPKSTHGVLLELYELSPQ